MCPSVLRVSHHHPQFTMRQSQCQRCEWAWSQPWAAASLSDKGGCWGLGAPAGPSDPWQCSSGVGELHHTPEGAWHRGPLLDWALAIQHHYPPQAEKRSSDAGTEARYRYGYCMLRKEDVGQRCVCVSPWFSHPVCFCWRFYVTSFVLWNDPERQTVKRCSFSCRNIMEKNLTPPFPKNTNK